MSQHSVAQARNQLSALIDRALAGEGVVITRHGHPVVELTPVKTAVGPITRADLDWLAANRIPTTSKTDAAVFIRRMRDDDWA